MNDIDKKHYPMSFIEEDGKNYVLFYDSQVNLVAKRVIPQQDVNKAIRLKGENN